MSSIQQGFTHQAQEFSILTDEYNWILVWHPDGPVYREKAGRAPELLGRRSYFNRLQFLLASVLDRKAKLCRDLADLSDKLPGIVEELQQVSRLSEVEWAISHSMDMGE